MRKDDGSAESFFYTRRCYIRDDEGARRRLDRPGTGVSVAKAESEAAGVLSIEVGLRLLKPLVAAGGPLSLKQIAEACHCSAPKAHRYLTSFIRAGLVQRTQTRGLYDLGPFAAELGFAAIGRIDREQLGRDAMVELADRLNFTVCLVIWTDNEPVVIGVEAPSGPMFTGIRTGSRLPVLQSASGLVFVATLPPAAQRRVIEQHGRKDGVDPKAALRQLAAVRAAGFAHVRDSVMPGMSGVAVPIRNEAGETILVLTSLERTSLFEARTECEVVAEMKRVADAVSARLGWRADVEPAAAEALRGGC